MKNAKDTSRAQSIGTGPIVFLIEDDEKIRTTLSRALNKRGFRVSTFADAMQFLETYNSSQPGCLVLDYGLPHINGLELQQRMTAENINLPIIFITGHGGVRESVQAMKAGAIDFLEKPFRQHTLIDCIERAFDVDQTAREAEDIKRRTLMRFGLLTTREKEVANYMISHPSSTASKEIGRALSISPRTVDHHRAKILEKLEIHSVAELIDLSKSI